MEHKYSKVFKALRAKHGETQEDCAKLIGKSLPTYRNKENGIAPFSIEEAFTLLEHWDEPINKLKDFL